MPEREKLGARAKAVRKEKGKTQAEMAKFLGLSTTTWQKIERDEGLPNGETLMLFEKLGVNPGWLLTGLGPKYIGAADQSHFEHDVQVIAKLGDLVSRVHKELGIRLPAGQESAEAVKLYAVLKRLPLSGADLKNIEPALPLLEDHLRNRLEKARAEPGTGKREVS